MKKPLITLSLASLALLTGVSSCQQGEDLTIFHTNDIHLHLEAARTDPFGLGGLARMHTVLERRRAEVDRSILIDAGDFSEGSWHYNLDTGASMLRLMDLMGFDAAALGNHDFLNGPDRVIETVEESSATFPVLAANLDLSAYSQAERFRRAVPEYVIHDVKGVKVGVIGLTTFELVYDSYMAPVKITNPVDRAKAIAADLRPQVDVMLITSHNSFEVNEQLARSVQGIDAVISGHSHRKISEPVMVENAGRKVPLVEAYQWGKFLGELTLRFDRKTGKVEFRDWRLHSMGPEIPDSEPVAQAIRGMNDRLSREFGGGDIKRVLTNSAFPLEKANDFETPLGNLTVAAYREATGADLALEQANFTSVGIAAGPITAHELHDVMPHIYDHRTGKEWTVKLWNARGSDLMLVMTVFYTISSFSPFSSPLGWLLVDNAVVTWDPKGDRAANNPIPIRSVRIAGKALDPLARYRVATSEGLLFAIRQANDLLKLGIDLTQITDSGIEASRAIMNYGAQRAELSLDALDVGRRMLTLSSDLAIQSYNVAWDGSDLLVDVRNLGLTTSTEGTLVCSSGLRDDRVRYGTPQQVWTEIGRLPIPALPPNGTEGNRITLKMPWDQANLESGVWPVRCEARSAGDKYAPNNAADKTFRR